eukprot:TRINITY_DN32632_c0_g1_i1.p1 TRINITY_DN32632_c0_g1~~TRINITY_DN32632_c0_g1_i1.p1  ORF type:complete len:108 (+),score=15.74 TRINITY_DN32632_c0_g1_i1:48-326(+)
MERGFWAFMGMAWLVTVASVECARPLYHHQASSSSRAFLGPGFHVPQGKMRTESVNDSGRGFFWMLPKGPVTPSGPSHIYNGLPTTSISQQP